MRNTSRGALHHYTWQALIDFYRNHAHISPQFINKNSMLSLRKLSPNNIEGTCWSYVLATVRYSYSATQDDRFQNINFSKEINKSQRFLIYFKSNIPINSTKQMPSEGFIGLTTKWPETKDSRHREETKTVNLKNICPLDWKRFFFRFLGIQLFFCMFLCILTLKNSWVRNEISLLTISL